MTNYKTFDLLVTIDGTVKLFESLRAIDTASALADIGEAFAGEVLLVQYRVL